MFSMLRPVSILLTLLSAVPALAVAPQSCEEMQARMESLTTAIDEAANETVAAGLQAELDSLSMRYATQCLMRTGLPAMPANLGDLLNPDKMRPAGTPQEEIKRRREAINLAFRQFGNNPAALRDAAGEREVPIQQAIPIDGTVLVEGGSLATFYHAAKRDLRYTIRETYVGNLIVSRYYDRIAGRYTGREEYEIQTLSTGIEVLGFSGRECGKFTGSPSVCTQWHTFDRWRIGDGEQYQGMYDGVVGAESDEQSVTVTVDAADIHFESAQGRIGAKSGCGDDFKETVSHQTFKDWLRRSEIRLTREIGNEGGKAQYCRPGATLTLEMRIRQQP